MPDDVARGGGSGRRNPGFETRVALLEAAVEEIRVELRAIRAEISALGTKNGVLPSLVAFGGASNAGLAGVPPAPTNPANDS